MPLTANAEVLRMAEGVVEYPVAANVIVHQGALLGLTGGRVRPLVAGDVLAGVAYEAVSNAGGAAGAVAVRAQIRGIFRLAGASFTQAAVGALVYATDDATVTLTATNNSLVGRCVKYESASLIWVRLAN